MIEGVGPSYWQQMSPTLGSKAQLLSANYLLYYKILAVQIMENWKLNLYMHSMHKQYKICDDAITIM